MKSLHPRPFHPSKAAQIRKIKQVVARDHQGPLPCDLPTLIHVRRVTNRWGLVRAATPEQTMAALEDLTTERDRVRVNGLLVPFGKHICTGRLPWCSRCPVQVYCRQVGVSAQG